MVRGDPDGVQRTGKDTREGKDDTERAGGLDFRIRAGKGIIVGDHADSNAGGDQGNHSIARESGAVEEEIHKCNRGGQENSRHLIEGDCRKCEGEIGKDDVESHGNGERNDVLDGHSSWLEEAKTRARESE